MKKASFNPILMVIIAFMTLLAVSCKKKEVKEVQIDSQFAISLYYDNISLKDIIHDMDSTTSTWLRVRNDSLFVVYSDSVNNVLKASDLMSNLEDQANFNTTTPFTLPEVTEEEPKDTTMMAENFATVPFSYDGFEIQEVNIRQGTFSFDLGIDPPIPALKQVVIYSDQLVSQDDVPVRITIDYEVKGRQSVDLAGYKIIPDDNQNVSFSGEITFHYDPEEGTVGGDYVCTVEGGLTDVYFRNVSAVVTKQLDSVFRRKEPIDFGIRGLSGQAELPIPTIDITYRNTFGLRALTDVTKLRFFNANTLEEENLLASDHVDVDIYPTNGEYRSFRVMGLQHTVNALGGYTRLDFNGETNLAMPGDVISISDTSVVDVIADIEMPMSFKLTDLRYMDTIEVKFGNDVNVQDYLENIDFFIDYENHIPIEMCMQGVFLRHGRVIDSLFSLGDTILYNRKSTVECDITGKKLENVMKSDHMILRFGVSTEFQDEPVILMDTNNIIIRMRMLTRTNEINLGD